VCSHLPGGFTLYPFSSLFVRSFIDLHWELGGVVPWSDKPAAPREFRVLHTLRPPPVFSIATRLV